MPLKSIEVASLERACSLGQSVGGGGANRACPAHEHVANGTRCFANIGSFDELEPMRQQPLLNQDDATAPRVEADGAVRAGAAIDGHVHSLGKIRTGKGKGYWILTLLERIRARICSKSSCSRRFCKSGSLSSHLKSLYPRSRARVRVEAACSTRLLKE